MLYFIYFISAVIAYSWSIHKMEYKQYEKQQKELKRRSKIKARNGHKYLGTTDEGDDIFEGDVVEYDCPDYVKGHWEHHIVQCKAEKACNECHIEHVHLVASGE